MKLIRIARGKEDIVEEGDRSKLNKRLKQLRQSTMRGCSGQCGRKYPVKYELRD